MFPRRDDNIGSMEDPVMPRGDLDLLLVHADCGVCLIDDRCPHMSAPLSLGTLDGCVVACPLHSGRFDLAGGGTVQFPTTGGLDADGISPAVDTAGQPAQARAVRQQGAGEGCDASTPAALLPAAHPRRHDRSMPARLS
jgi:nitrite reductase/ring-hydroxylating ferredoxin subunit